MRLAFLSALLQSLLRVDLLFRNSDLLIVRQAEIAKVSPGVSQWVSQRGSQGVSPGFGRGRAPGLCSPSRNLTDCREQLVDLQQAVR